MRSWSGCEFTGLVSNFQSVSNCVEKGAVGNSGGAHFNCIAFYDGELDVKHGKMQQRLREGYFLLCSHRRCIEKKTRLFGRVRQTAAAPAPDAADGCCVHS